jgi:hypothetical protein
VEPCQEVVEFSSGANRVWNANNGCACRPVTRDCRTSELSGDKFCLYDGLLGKERSCPVEVCRAEAA